MGKWKICELGNLIKFQRGHDLPKSKMVAGKYPVVGSNGIIGWHNEYTTEAPSITVGRSGNVGNPFIYYGRSWSHNTTLYIKEYKNTDPVFIYYFLKTLNLSNYAGGSAVPTLNRNHIHTLKVSVPETIEEQHNIGMFLKLFDDKIQQNIRINKNLEQQAQAIFQERFQHHDKLPERWKTMTLADVSIMSAGGDKPNTISSQKTSEYQYPIYSNGISNDGLYGYSSDYKFDTESVTVSARGTIGFVCLRHIPYTPIVRLVTLIPHTNLVSAKYLYLWLKSIPIHGTGTTQQQLTVPDFRKTEIIVPSESEMRSFTDTVTPFYQQIWANQDESTKLADIRDSLLPKLMSGEIDVSDIDL